MLQPTHLSAEILHCVPQRETDTKLMAVGPLILNVVF